MNKENQRKHGHKGKRIKPTATDPTTKKLITMFESKANHLSALAEARGWTVSLYLDRILDGNEEIHAEFFGDQSP